MPCAKALCDILRRSKQILNLISISILVPYFALTLQSVSGNRNSFLNSPRGNAQLKSREPKLPNRRHSTWRSRVHPLFFDFVNEIRKVSEASTASRKPQVMEANQALPGILQIQRSLLRELLNAAVKHRRISNAKGKALSKVLLQPPPLPDIVRSHFCQIKYRRSPKELSRELVQDHRTVPKITEIVRLMGDWWHGKLEHKDFRFKTDELHASIMWEGLFCGLAALTDRELADCFDEVCNCDNVHVEENIKKFRRGWIRQFDRQAPIWRKICFRSSQVERESGQIGN